MVKDGRIMDAKTVMLSLFLERELGLPAVVRPSARITRAVS